MVLEGAPAALPGRAVRSGMLHPTAHARQRGAALMAQQAALQSRLEEKGARIKGRFTRLSNSLRLSLPPEKLAEVAALPGVKKVVRTRPYHRSITHALPFIGTPAAWAHPAGGTDGRNVRIGIIDSGIDYTHADFGGSGKVSDFTNNDPARIEPGTFPTAKVAGGYDFAGNSYNASDPLHSDPHPDPDPIDSSSEDGHGTHVAAIAAGLGVLTNGTTYAGPYSEDLDLRQFKIAPGIAPGALVYALKVFGTNGTSDLIIEALEWASDPNGDYDWSDRLDVVNLSLGTTFGTDDPEDPEVAAINNLVQLGCVVVCAAGNDGNVFYASSAPSTTSCAIAVGNSISRAERKALQVLSPSPVAGLYPMEEGNFTIPLADVGPIEGQVVYIEPPNACEDLVNADRLIGKIALIDRGSCFFTDKVQKAQDAGAVAVIMVNNQEGEPIVMGGENPAIFIPGVMISQAAGALLKAHLQETPTVRLDAESSMVLPELLDNLAQNSSRGPGGLGAVLKPEIVAPGAGIFSAAAGTGTEGNSLNGTSMAAPMVAGAAALLRQIHPAWTAEDIKAALMNSARLVHDSKWNLYPESLTGSGRLQVDRALRLEVTAAAAQAGGNVALSFGLLELVPPFQTNRTILLSNHSSNTVTFDVAVSNTVPQIGVSLIPEVSSITVPALGTASLRVTLSVNPVQFQLQHDSVTPREVGSLMRQRLYEFSGQIWFLQASQSLHLPFYAGLRNASDYRAKTNLLVLDTAQATRKNVNLAIPLQGLSIPTNALLSAFECGATITHENLGSPYYSAAQLTAVGAASDIAAAGSVENARVFFGLATATSWPTPQPSYISLQVLVDTNHDRKADFLISNDNATRTNAGPDAADVFLTIVQDLDSAGNPLNVKSDVLLNIFPPDELDTAPFNNSVMVLGVTALHLGLSSNHSRFLYRVATLSRYESVSETDWIDFDAAHPALDTAAHGLQGTPFYADNQPVTVHVDREAMASRRPSPSRVLLLYPHNRQGQRMEVVRLDMSNGDQDQDGLEDWWEMVHFSTLSMAGEATDSDRDGMSDNTEYQAGTDPADPLSHLTLLSVLPQADGEAQLHWSSVAGKYYSILYSTNLLAHGWSILASNQFATPPANSFMDSNRRSSGARFYQIRLEP